MNDTLIPLIAICWILCAFLCAFIAQTKRLRHRHVGARRAHLRRLRGARHRAVAGRSTTPDGEPDNAQPVTPLQQWLSTPSLSNYRNQKRNHS